MNRALAISFALHAAALGVLARGGGAPCPARPPSATVIVARTSAESIRIATWTRSTLPVDPIDPEPALEPEFPAPASGGEFLRDPVPVPPDRYPEPTAQVSLAPLPSAPPSEPVASASAPPAARENAPPPYPAVAIRNGWQGIVLLRVVVGADGRCKDVRVTLSSGYACLDEAAFSTIRDRWAFDPALRNGAPVEATIEIPVRFVLR